MPLAGTFKVQMDIKRVTCDIIDQRYLTGEILANNVSDALIKFINRYSIDPESILSVSIRAT